MPHCAPAVLDTAFAAPASWRGRARGLWRGLRRTLGALLALCVVALTVALSALAALPAVDGRAMAVTSGSMEPGIAVGSLLVVRAVDPEAVRPGDVLTYQGHSRQGLTTHRVLSKRYVQGVLHFQTQGDANASPDVDLTPADAVLGRAVLDLPHAGRALGALSHPHTRFVVLGLPAAWMAFSQLRVLRVLLRARGRHRTSSRPGAVSALQLTHLLAPVAATIALTVAVSSPGTLTTKAVLGDTVLVVDNSFATGSW